MTPLPCLREPTEHLPSQEFPRACTTASDSFLPDRQDTPGSHLRVRLGQAAADAAREWTWDRNAAAVFDLLQKASYNPLHLSGL